VFPLLLVLLFGMSTYAWFTFFVKGKALATPNLIGKTVADAKAICSDAGVTLQVDDTKNRNSDKVPAGAVVWQNRDPGPTNFIKRGTRIRVGQSLGPLVLSVPDLKGQSPGTAILRLGQQNLKLGDLAYADVAGSGIVAADPPDGTVVGAQTAVSFLVATPAAAPVYVMPDIIDRPIDEVRPLLQGKGLAVSNVRYEAYPGIADGTIIRQYPLRGAPVSARDAITVVVTRQDATGIIEQSPQAVPTSPAPPAAAAPAVPSATQ
jgi:beta-lactam-binding protein with PASTA domain